MGLGGGGRWLGGGGVGGIHSFNVEVETSSRN